MKINKMEIPTQHALGQSFIKQIQFIYGASAFSSYSLESTLYAASFNKYRQKQ